MSRRGTDYTGMLIRGSRHDGHDDFPRHQSFQNPMNAVYMVAWGLTTWEVVSWALWGIVLVDLLSIALGFSRWRAVIFLQSATPLLLPVTVAMATAAVITGRMMLFGAAMIEVTWLTALLVLSVHQQHRQVPAGNALLKIAHANVLHSNPTPERAVADILASDAHIIAFSEITEDIHRHAELHPAAEAWPHRIHDLRDGPRGIALWSKLPLASSTIERMHDCHAVIAVVEGETRLQVLAIHPMAPVSQQKTRDWSPSLQMIGQVLIDADLPTVAIGDYNATHWHPPMRRLYRQGVHSAHLRLGRVLSASFPVGRRLRPFVLLDHALVTDDVQVHDLVHLTVDGSDHRGIVVEVSCDSNLRERSAR